MFRECRLDTLLSCVSTLTFIDVFLFLFQVQRFQSSRCNFSRMGFRKQVLCFLSNSDGIHRNNLQSSKAVTSGHWSWTTQGGVPAQDYRRINVVDRQWDRILWIKLKNVILFKFKEYNIITLMPEYFNIKTNTFSVNQCLRNFLYSQTNKKWGFLRRMCFFHM